jgi:hypothetical protein
MVIRHDEHRRPVLKGMACVTRRKTGPPFTMFHAQEAVFQHFLAFIRTLEAYGAAKDEGPTRCLIPIPDPPALSGLRQRRAP